MGIVAPVSAVMTAVVPMLFGFFIEGLPRTTQLMGFCIGMSAVWFLSASGEDSGLQKNELVLALAAGLGFGSFFICIDRVSDNAILWPLMAARMASISVMAMLLVGRGKMGFPQRNQVPYIILAGVLDTAGNAFFAMSSQLGRLDVSALLASMYPASTVVLAWCILKERLNGRQWVGLLAALGALALIAS
jgi:drug/metabolite transporter (DMT)-like permease